MKAVWWLAWAGALVGCQPMPEKPAQAVIEGKQEVAAGAVLVLSGEKSTGQVWEWSGDGDCQLVPMDSGKRVVIVPPTGKHQVTLRVWSAAGGVLSRSEAIHEFTAGDIPPGPGPAPPLPPGPGPSPIPPGPLPDGKYGLAKWAKSSVEQLVSSGSRPADARIVAGVFRDVASQIAAGGLRDTMGIANTTLDQIESRLGSNQAAWATWISALMAKTRSTFSHASPVSDIGAGWLEIAQGLEAVQ